MRVGRQPLHRSSSLRRKVLSTTDSPTILAHFLRPLYVRHDRQNRPGRRRSQGNPPADEPGCLLSAVGLTLLGKHRRELRELRREHGLAAADAGDARNPGAEAPGFLLVLPAGRLAQPLFRRSRLKSARRNEIVNQRLLGCIRYNRQDAGIGTEATQDLPDVVHRIHGSGFGVSVAVAGGDVGADDPEP